MRYSSLPQDTSSSSAGSIIQTESQQQQECIQQTEANSDPTGKQLPVDQSETLLGEVIQCAARATSNPFIGGGGVTGKFNMYVRIGGGGI